MAPKKKKEGGAKKSTKEVAQESTGVLWLMEKTGFDKKELVRPELRPELPATATPSSVRSHSLHVPLALRRPH